jgi:hypothetical protein
VCRKSGVFHVPQTRQPSAIFGITRSSRAPPPVIRAIKIRVFLLVVGVTSGSGCVWAQGGSGVDPQQIQALIEQNRLLQQQVSAQQQTIDALQAKITTIGQSTADQGHELQGLRDRLDGSAGTEAKSAAPSDIAVRVSGEVGLAFFVSGSDGAYNNGEFRVDDAKIFVEAPVWQNVYFHSELDLVTRETIDSNTHIGELYAEAESIPGPWSQDLTVNLRAGRMYVPFGEEYQVRGIMENPLISHSVSDIWGMDEGVEAYGRAGGLNYFVAVQDGGLGQTSNVQTDKSVAGRIGYDPTSWLHLSGSAMRTGELNSTTKELSALWFGNGFFTNIGPAAATSYYSVNLFELDAAARWAQGDFKISGGIADYGDNNALRSDSRRLKYYSAELMQNLIDRLYGAVRFSGISVPAGYPLVGEATEGEYLFSGLLTTDLERLSVGLGYQFGPPLVLKMEYTAESGHTVTGESRDRENLFATELGLKF